MTSSAQFDMVTRRARRAPPAKEFPVHAAIADILRVSLTPGWLWWHTPNGGYVLGKATAGQLKRMGVRAGVSDFILVGPQGRVHALELKRRGIRPSEAQIAFLEAVRAAGGHSDWVDTYDDAIGILKGWGAVRVRLGGMKEADHGEGDGVAGRIDDPLRDRGR